MGGDDYRPATAATLDQRDLIASAPWETGDVRASPAPLGYLRGFSCPGNTTSDGCNDALILRGIPRCGCIGGTSPVADATQGCESPVICSPFGST